MRKLLGTAALAAVSMALAACQPGASGTQASSGGAPVASVGGMATFTDPTENAFTMQAPRGWNTKGGIQRASAIAATPWLTTTSPDGSTAISVGDPSIPPFTLPSAQHPAGSSFQGPGGTTTMVKDYESGTQFASDYAQKVFGQTCGQLQPTGTAPEPDLAQAAQDRAANLAQSVGAPPPQARFDGGSAHFTCASDGSAVAVIDVTAVSQSQVGGFWNVPTLIAYRTPASKAAETEQTARAMRQSYQMNAQWQAQMAAATRQQLAQIQAQGQQQMAQLTAQERQESGMLNAQAQANQQRLNDAHATTMAQLNAQGAARNQNFAQHMYDKETGQQSEMRYINNQTCIRWADAAHTRCAATAQN